MSVPKVAFAQFFVLAKEVGSLKRYSTARAMAGALTNPHRQF